MTSGQNCDSEKNEPSYSIRLNGNRKLSHTKIELVTIDLRPKAVEPNEWNLGMHRILAQPCPFWGNSAGSINTKPEHAQ